MPPVCSGATLSCTCGVGTSELRASTRGLSYEQNRSAATVADCQPLVNIPPFAACTSTLSPQPPVGGGRACAPSFATLWTSRVASIRIDGLPVLDDTATILCTYGGMVRIQSPGQSFANHTRESINDA